MRKYKFLFIFVIVFAVFLVMSWFIYDGIDLFFDLVYRPTKDKEVKVSSNETKKKEQRPKYVEGNTGSEIIKKDQTPAPDTRYITTRTTVERENSFEKFLRKIFPEQLSYVLNPYTFFLILILTVLPMIGIFIYLVIYYLR